jgi:hypothetical protein
MLQYGFTTAVLTRPTVWYLSLHTGFPGDTGTSILNEFTSGADASYVRTQLTGGNALALTSHIIQNGGSVTVGPAGGTWAAATFMGLCDASSASNLWSYMELSQSGATFFLAAQQFANPGSGYAVNDVLTLTGGGGATVTIDTVTTVNGVTGVPTQAHITAAAHGSLSAIPANPLATTGGTGTGATILGSWLAAPQSFQLNNGDSITFATGTILQAMG